jgi:hypothetical protein
LEPGVRLGWVSHSPTQPEEPILPSWGAASRQQPGHLPHLVEEGRLQHRPSSSSPRGSCEAQGFANLSTLTIHTLQIHLTPDARSQTSLIPILGCSVICGRVLKHCKTVLTDSALAGTWLGHSGLAHLWSMTSEASVGKSPMAGSGITKKHFHVCLAPGLG